MTLPSYAICTAETEVEGVKKYKAQLAELQPACQTSTTACQRKQLQNRGVRPSMVVMFTAQIVTVESDFCESCPCLLIFQAKAEFDVWIRKLDCYQSRCSL